MRFKFVGLALAMALVASDASAVLVEDFECATWPCTGWVLRSGGGGGSVGAAAVHDGLKGLVTTNSSWYCKSSGPGFPAAVGAGAPVLSMWTRHVGTAGRTYFCFAGSAAGAKCFVSAPNTGDIRFQDNGGFGFVEGTAAPFTHVAGTWYQMRVDLTGAPTANGKLFSETGTELASVTHVYPSIASGEICVRTFSGQQADTIESGPPVPKGACCVNCLLPGFNCSVQTEEACGLTGACYLGDDTVCTSFTGTGTVTGMRTPGLPVASTSPPAVDMMTIAAPGSAIGDVDVHVNMSHTWLADVQIDVASPAPGASVNIFDNACGSNNNINATFDDEAATAIVCATCTTGACLSVSGTVRPSFPLSGLDLKPADGSWTITAADTVGGDSGTLIDWSLDIDIGTTDDQCSSPEGLGVCPACSGGGGTTGSDKVLICHMTGSKTEPFFHTILVSPSSVGAHIGDESHEPHCNPSGECDFLGECPED